MVFDKTTEKQLNEQLPLDKYKYISDCVNIKLISKVINLIITCAEKEKKHNQVYCHWHPKLLPWLNQFPF